MATHARPVSWRAAGIAAAFAVLAWVGFEIGRAGNDVPPPRPVGESTLAQGVLSGKRIDGRAWTMDYDKVTMSPDATYATIEHVRDGRIHRPGKPDVLVRADGVTVNTITNDLTITGPVTITDPERDGTTRVLRTVGAQYIGSSHTLILQHPATITADGATITVGGARMDFRTGATQLGRIVGTRPGS